MQIPRNPVYRALISFTFLFFAFFYLPIITHANLLSKAPPYLGLVGYWSLNEGTGSVAVDLSGNGKNGTLVNSPTWTKGMLGKALNFSAATSQYMVAAINPAGVSADPDVTVSFWVKGDLIPGTQTGIFQYASILNDGFPFILFAKESGTGDIKLYIDSTYFYDFTSISNGEWYHVAVTRDSTDNNWRIYKNGVQVSIYTDSGTPTNVSNADSVYLGNGYDAFYSGSIDEVRVYSRKLSSAEILQLFNSGGSVIHKSSSNLGLIGYWSLNEESGTTAADYSGNHKDLSLNNFSNPATASSGWGNGKSGKALNFDGNNDYITGPDIDFPSGNFTISAWFKTSTGVAPRIVSKWSTFSNINYEIYLDGTTNITGSVYDGADWQVAVKSGNYMDGKWHHVVFTVDSTTLTIYVDGVVGGTDTFDGSIPINDQPLEIGAATMVPDYFQGSIDEVRIYNRALSASDVADLYNSSGKSLTANGTQTQVVSSGLIGHWPFDGKYMNWGTGLVTDVSGTGNNGQVINMSTTTSPVMGKIGQALKFDGIDDEVTSGNFADALGEMSASVWFKQVVSAYPPYKPLIAKMDDPNTGAGWGLFMGALSPYDKITFLTQDSGGTHWNQYTTNTGYSDGQWHHAVATLTGGVNGTITIYIDGVSVPITNVGSGTVGSNSNAVPVRIGGNPNAKFDGSLDEPRVYNRALSATEVLRLYNAGR